jgi:hypothetical protein
VLLRQTHTKHPRFAARQHTRFQFFLSTRVFTGKAASGIRGGRKERLGLEKSSHSMINIQRKGRVNLPIRGLASGVTELSALFLTSCLPVISHSLAADDDDFLSGLDPAGDA